MKMSDYQRIQKIIRTGRQLLQFVSEEQVSRQQIKDNTIIQWVVTTPLYNLGEHTSHLSKELQTAHPEIPWRQITGMRHRLVHDYDDTDWEIIGDAIFNALPSYLDALECILQELS